jgi:hypothetical protein
VASACPWFCGLLHFARMEIGGAVGSSSTSKPGQPSHASAHNYFLLSPGTAFDMQGPQTAPVAPPGGPNTLPLSFGGADPCNLIINYLPSDLTDEGLRVSPLLARPQSDPLRGERIATPKPWPLVLQRGLCQERLFLVHRQTLFESYGEIESARVIKERGSMKSLGYGFVKFIR